MDYCIFGNVTTNKLQYPSKLLPSHVLIYQNKQI